MTNCWQTFSLCMWCLKWFWIIYQSKGERGKYTKTITKKKEERNEQRKTNICKISSKYICWHLFKNEEEGMKKKNYEIKWTQKQKKETKNERSSEYSNICIKQRTLFRTKERQINKQTADQKVSNWMASIQKGLDTNENNDNVKRLQLHLCVFQLNLFTFWFEVIIQALTESFELEYFYKLKYIYSKWTKTKTNDKRE